MKLHCTSEGRSSGQHLRQNRAHPGQRTESGRQGITKKAERKNSEAAVSQIPELSTPTTAKSQRGVLITAAKYKDISCKTISILNVRCYCCCWKCFVSGNRSQKGLCLSSALYLYGYYYSSLSRCRSHSRPCLYLSAYHPIFALSSPYSSYYPASFGLLSQWLCLLRLGVFFEPDVFFSFWVPRSFLFYCKVLYPHFHPTLGGCSMMWTWTT